MSYDCDGYKASVSDPLIGYIPPLAGPNFYGSGGPESVIKAPVGSTYVDVATGNLYVKQVGAGNTGWTLVTGGSGGAVQIFFGSGDPNGVVTATRPAAFYTALGAWWVKTGAGASNTGWEIMIAGA